ncbi:hypothetical protein CEUSTIGMA_g7105.t1 [Chlamydomonas eustigma]|uniref:Mediator of RNA polymerase II transcription subunit 11 n=1 Tax=Chlamydomonas eustigma TaxID=1157962 RepID=A0A250X9B3_9CHLO|nr:hypothetical protein CEUSTIGMA_g7105.t1 [Chlamydomonas eustigma]|eukprot:GAX79664.1 hypothetical protein CEUSTIGMA_g7105.t1 [Chlamydomonas eustigma]
MPDPTSATGPADLARIQEIEERVIRGVELASSVTELLSSIGNVDKDKVKQMCVDFLENMKTAQSLVQAALTKPAVERTFEANSYQAQARAYIAAEKVHTVQGYLSCMETCLVGREDNAVELEVHNGMDVDSVLVTGR